MNYEIEDLPENPKQRSTDRVLILEPIEGKTVLGSKGEVKSKLFSTDTPLHCTMDGATLMWSFKYEKGAIPPALNGRWTNFRNAYKEAETYFAKRNVRVKEVRD